MSFRGGGGRGGRGGGGGFRGRGGGGGGGFRGGGRGKTCSFSSILKGDAIVSLIFQLIISIVYLSFSVNNYGEKTKYIFITRILFHGMTAILDFRAITKVHITLKPLGPCSNAAKSCTHKCF